MVVHAHAGKLWGRLRTLDALRSIAVLAVCSFHYTNAQFIERFGHFQASGKYGLLGVKIFFVISGFIIPFSMFRAGYQVRSFFQFMLKRIARLDPPYLASIAIVVLGFWLSSLSPICRPEVCSSLPWRWQSVPLTSCTGWWSCPPGAWQLGSATGRLTRTFRSIALP